MEKVKKILVIVPHQDDEINLIGSIVDQIIYEEVELYITFVTNGDSKSERTEERIRESLKVGELYKVKRILFLGYGDDYIDEHIYSSDTRVSVSKAGKSNTYCINGIKEFCFENNGIHHSYKKENLVKDIKNCIYTIKADMVIYNDCDPHPDHIAVSLCCDEAIKELIVENNYKPIVLKKFAYDGVWNGEKDYFRRPMRRTLFLEGYKSLVRFYSDEDYVRVHVNKLNYDLFFGRSPVFKALSIYRTQYAIQHFRSIVNSDSVFFYRRTDNQSLNARVISSSGNPSYINDNKLYDFKNVRDFNSVEGIWKPDIDDTRPSVFLKFKDECTIAVVRIHLYSTPLSRVESIIIQNEIDEENVQVPIDQNVINIHFNKKHITKSLKIIINKYVGNEWGIREIETFENNIDFPWEMVPFRRIDRIEKERREHYCRAIELVYYMAEKIKIRFDNMLMHRKNKRFVQ